MVKMLNEEELENVTGGIRPEEIGEPIMLSGGIVSYRICTKCGACMFPVKIRHVSGNLYLPTYPDYVCSECGERIKTIRVH